jgi:putative hydrolase of the HAD superfamily
LGLDLSWDEFEAGWNAIYFEVFEEVQRALASLLVPAVALTNTNAIHCRAWQTKYADVLSLFRWVYASSEMGLRKPEAAIYRAVLESECVAADEALFFDDNEDNVEGARTIGIDSVLVDSAGDVVDALRARDLLAE